MPSLDAHRVQRRAGYLGARKSCAWARQFMLDADFLLNRPSERPDTHRHAGQPVGRPEELGELILGPTRDVFSLDEGFRRHVVERASDVLRVIGERYGRHPPPRWRFYSPASPSSGIVCHVGAYIPNFVPNSFAMCCSRHTTAHMRTNGEMHPSH
jgi:hypothetical protein